MRPKAGRQLPWSTQIGETRRQCQVMTSVQALLKGKADSSQALSALPAHTAGAYCWSMIFS